MGITGLLPFITDSQQGALKKVSIREFKGQTAAIDGYVLLHRGAFSCAKQLFEGQDTDVFISHCMRYVDLLQKHGVRPLLVFDGAALAVKRDTERQRRDVRQVARKQAVDLLSAGRTSDAYQAMARAIDVTHKMALRFIQVARKRGIDSIVAPYEADAQLVHLTRSGLADFVITEDSDLIVFGCEKVLFKLQLTGEGQFYDKSLLEGALCSKKLRCNNYNFDKFRIACILSGCDYIKSLPGIGLAKAWKFASITDNLENLDFKLPKMTQYLNMSGLDVTEEYIQQVKIANGAFKHQIVYDPVERRRRPLEEFHEDNANCVITTETVGQLEMDENESFDRALGNIDPMSGVQLDNYRPLHHIPINSSSIWSKNRLSQSTLTSAVISTQNHALKTKGLVNAPKLQVKTTAPSSQELEVEDVKLTTLLQQYSKIDTKMCSTVRNCYYKELYDGQNDNREEKTDIDKGFLHKNPFIKKEQNESADETNYRISCNKENVDEMEENKVDGLISPIKNNASTSPLMKPLNINNKTLQSTEKCPFRKQRNIKYDQLFVQKRKASENEYFSSNKSKKTKLEDTTETILTSESEDFVEKENNDSEDNEITANTSLSANNNLVLEHLTATSNLMKGDILNELSINIENISAHDSEGSDLENANKLIDLNYDNFLEKTVVNKEIETLCNDVDTISVQSGESHDLIPMDQMVECILETNDDDADIETFEQNSPITKRHKKNNVNCAVAKIKSSFSKGKRQTNLFDFFKKV